MGKGVAWQRGWRWEPRACTRATVSAALVATVSDFISCWRAIESEERWLNSAAP